MIRPEFQVHRDAAGKRRRASKTLPPFSKVDSRTVDQRVWKTAMRLAGGDHARIVVVSSTEVRVINR